ALGTNAGINLTTGNNNVDIANDGKAGESKVIRIGTTGNQTRTWIAGISGRTVNGTGTPVVVNAQGQLGTASAAKPASARIVDRLRAQNRSQARKIATLQREVSKLTGH